MILDEYLKSPCRASSIPYWKQKSIVFPDNMKIVHDDDYFADGFADYLDEPYFRLYHGLNKIGLTNCKGIEVITATPDLTRTLAEIINLSYDDLSVTEEQLKSYRETPVYAPDLWILLKDTKTGVYIGGGIADYDGDTGELIIEWVQVLPEYRSRGYGSIIVNNLLARMRATAKFATVSGKIKSPSNPEKLYRKCGFTGSDIWHILYKR